MSNYYNETVVCEIIEHMNTNLQKAVAQLQKHSLEKGTSILPIHAVVRLFLSRSNNPRFIVINDAVIKNNKGDVLQTSMKNLTEGLDSETIRVICTTEGVTITRPWMSPISFKNDESDMIRMVWYLVNGSRGLTDENKTRLTNVVNHLKTYNTEEMVQQVRDINWWCGMPSLLFGVYGTDAVNAFTQPTNSALQSEHTRYRNILYLCSKNMINVMDKQNDTMDLWLRRSYGMRDDETYEMANYPLSDADKLKLRLILSIQSENSTEYIDKILKKFPVTSVTPSSTPSITIPTGLITLSEYLTYKRDTEYRMDGNLNIWINNTLQKLKTVNLATVPRLNATESFTDVCVKVREYQVLRKFYLNFAILRNNALKK